MVVMVNDLLLAWPDQLPDRFHTCSDPLLRAAWLIRSSRWQEAEALLLASTPCSGNALMLLLHLRLLQHQFQSVETILEQQDSGFRAEPFSRYLQLQCWFVRSDLHSLSELKPDYWRGEQQEPLLALGHVAWAMGAGAHDLAADLLCSPAIPDCLERTRLQARLLKANGKLHEAIALLEMAAERAPSILGVQQHLQEYLLEAHAYDKLVPRFRVILQRYGEAPEILTQVATTKLLQRQPGRARRAALLARLKSQCRSEQSSITNQLICYEQTGYSDWLEHLHPSLLGQDADPNLLANLVMQLASVESPLSEKAASRFCALMQQRNQAMGLIGSGVSPEVTRSDKALHVVWMSGDICDHPVGRFLLSFFKAGEHLCRHKHTVVTWCDLPNNPFPGYFQAISGLTVVDARAMSATNLFSTVQALQPDVAVDLSGWTAKNFGNGFLARLAPLQINYLGYYASTGNPSMDVWLGDASLFPEPMHEWHSETIHRLSRCFIAWQPPSQLPEAHVPVSCPPSGPVRFGSFNHNRKFSDRVLGLWGQILAAVPDSQLVLKATATGDELTLELLKKRMRCRGLDPDRVVWLPLVAANRDHLLQYGELDIALDCLPNGGCTTTCEALWMGVPVITLTGRSYVSRMSTAVLHGAGLPEWCVATEHEYVALAVAQAARLAQLRAQRHSWRQRLQASSLGDAADLMQHLEQAFSELYQQRCAAPARVL
jgi:protein O-GlcNAc transferase